MRICIPNFKLIAEEYIRGTKSQNAEKAASSLYARKKKNQIYGHKWMYDEKYLSKILENCGFNNIKILKNSILDEEVLDKYTSKQNIIIEVIK